MAQHGLLRARLNGTSMASPHVTGAVGLIAQAYRQGHGGNTPTPAQIIDILERSANTAKLPGWDTEEQGAGRLDVHQAVRHARGVRQPAAGRTSVIRRRRTSQAVTRKAPSAPRTSRAAPPPEAGPLRGRTRPRATGSTSSPLPRRPNGSGSRSDWAEAAQPLRPPLATGHQPECETRIRRARPGPSPTTRRPACSTRGTSPFLGPERVIEVSLARGRDVDDARLPPRGDSRRLRTDVRAADLSRNGWRPSSTASGSRSRS